MTQLSLALILTVGLWRQPDCKSPVHAASQTQPAKEKIRVFPTPNQQGSLTVQSAAKQQVSFYLFDVEGKLVFQEQFAKNEKQTIAGLAAGTYIYQVFQNDEELTGGHIALKN